MGAPRFLPERSAGVLGRTMAETINNVTDLPISSMAAIVAEVARKVRSPAGAGVFLRALADEIDPKKRSAATPPGGFSGPFAATRMAPRQVPLRPGSGASPRRCRGSSDRHGAMRWGPLRSLSCFSLACGPACPSPEDTEMGRVPDAAAAHFAAIVAKAEERGRRSTLPAMPIPARASTCSSSPMKPARLWSR